MIFQKIQNLRIKREFLDLNFWAPIGPSTKAYLSFFALDDTRTDVCTTACPPAPSPGPIPVRFDSEFEFSIENTSQYSPLAFADSIPGR